MVAVQRVKDSQCDRLNFKSHVDNTNGTQPVGLYLSDWFLGVNYDPGVETNVVRDEGEVVDAQVNSWDPNESGTARFLIGESGDAAVQFWLSPSGSVKLRSDITRPEQLHLIARGQMGGPVDRRTGSGPEVLPGSGPLDQFWTGSVF